ncbi:MAG: AMP-binding protein [Myxococcales bacterium]|nr:AMP-binding protein [Myxococcales bacterium]
MTTSSATSATSLADLFRRRVRQLSDECAAQTLDSSGEDGDEPLEMSWREWEARASECATALQSIGLAPGDRVALVLPLGLDALVVEMAIWFAGCVSVPLYLEDKPDEISRMLGQTEARAVFVADRPHWEMLSALRPSLPRLEHTIFYSDTVSPSVDLGAAGALTRDELRHRARRTSFSPPSVRPEDAAIISFTPGTQGQRKGVVLSHGNLLAQLDSLTRLLPLSSKDRCWIQAPVAHVYTKVFALLGTVVGYPLLLDPGPLRLRDDWVQLAPTFLVTYGPQLHRLYLEIVAAFGQRGGWSTRLFRWAKGIGRQVSRLRYIGRRPRGMLRLSYNVANRLFFRDLQARWGGGLRFVVYKGQPLATQALEFFHWVGLPALEAYGLTEATALTHLNPPDWFKLGTVGRVLPGLETAVADDGEIWVRGPSVMKGYLAPDDEASVDDEGWLHTGDVGELDDEGFLRVIDRKRDLISSPSGQSISPLTIENLLRTNRYIDSALVYGPGDDYLCALVTVEREAIQEFARKQGMASRNFAELTQDPRVYRLIHEVIEELNTQLPPYETIKKFVILDESFQREREELTATDTLKRQVVIEKYQHILRKLYPGNNR